MKQTRWLYDARGNLVGEGAKDVADIMRLAAERRERIEQEMEQRRAEERVKEVRSGQTR